MSSIQIRSNLAAPHAGKDSPLHLLIASKTRRAEPASSEFSQHELDALWTASWWGLADNRVFQKLTAKMQKNCIAACNRTILNEAYFIEKSGLAYSAKMSLLADSTDTAQLYALIGADEARHLAWIEPYVDKHQKTSPSGQFLSFLSTLIEEVQPHLLVYLVQIILEGWGLDHYKRLANDCQLPQLSRVFASILKDEALHHKSGDLLFDATALTASDIIFVKDSLKCYAEMVRVGPFAAVSAVEQVVGGLSVQEIAEVMNSLRHLSETARKLNLLKALMRRPGVEKLVDELDDDGYFAAMTEAEAARAYIACR